MKPFRYLPHNEQGVVVLFGYLLPHLPRQFQIQEIQLAFPDCYAIQTNPDGKDELLRIEFEFLSSNFISHNHDPEGCDLVICWEENKPLRVPCMSLKELAMDLNLFENLELHPQHKKKAVWNRESFLNYVDSEHLEMHSKLLEWAAAQNGELRFGSGNKRATWQLWVGEYFCIGTESTNMAWVHFDQLPSEVRRNHRVRLSVIRPESLDKVWLNFDMVDNERRALVTESTEILMAEIKFYLEAKSGRSRKM